MTSILDTNLLTPPLSSSLLDPLHPELYGTFGFDSLYSLGTSTQPNAFQSPSSSSSDNDFSTPPTSPESPPPPTSSPPLETTWIGSVETPITEAQLNPLLPGYQLNPLPVNARKRRGQVNRKSVRGGRGRGGRVSTGVRKKSLLTSPQLTPTTPSPLTSTSSTPSTPIPSKPEGDFPILATPDGTVPVDPSQLRELINDAVLKQKRLKRKAELARLSRKKKQLKMSDLEKQVAFLREENQKLMMQNATFIAERAKGESKDTKVQIVQPSISVPQSLPPVSFSPKSLEKAIAAINELFLPYGDIPSKQVELDEIKLTQLIAAISESFKKNTGSLEASLKQIEEALVPCTAMQFLEWALMQRDKFYQEENGLFMSLFRDEMNATPTQIAQLLRLRTQMQQQSLKMKDQVLVDAFRAFEKVLLQRGRLQQPDAFEQLRAIFTPRQLATYFRYVSQYGSVLIKVPV